jgi:CheY-like chemotaxis protein
MSTIRILHVDDDADIREVVALSLALDPALAVQSCPSGAEALTAAAEWKPDLILCDVAMPGMDGPTMLMELRRSPRTAGIPIVFMTARAQRRELDRFKALGATGVIVKPFDPMTLVDEVRAKLRAAKLVALRSSFVDRIRADAAALARYRTALQDGKSGSSALGEIKTLAHALSGAAGLFDLQAVSCAAFTLESAVLDTLDGSATPGKVFQQLDALIDCIGGELSRPGGGQPKVRADEHPAGNTACEPVVTGV